MTFSLYYLPLFTSHCFYVTYKRVFSKGRQYNMVLSAMQVDFSIFEIVGNGCRTEKVFMPVDGVYILCSFHLPLRKTRMATTVMMDSEIVMARKAPDALRFNGTASAYASGI